MKREKILIVILSFTVVILLLVMILGQSKSFHSICVNEDKWNMITSNRSENSNLILEEIQFNDYHLIIDEENSSIYYSLINNSSKKYTPNVTFETSDEKAKIAILEDEITDEKVNHNYAFQLMLYTSTEYHIYQLYCTNLPMVDIRYHLESDKDKNIPMEIYLFDNLDYSPNRVLKTPGRLSILENEEEKQEYMISLFSVSPGRNQREHRISIFNQKPTNRYILSSVEDNADENTTKQRVELFINKEYKGVYSLSGM